MAKQDFIPKVQDTYVKWHDNFLKELKNLPAGFGIGKDEMAGVQQQNDDLHAHMDAAVDADKNAKAAHADLNTTISDSQSAARGLTRRIKPNPAYTPALGNKLGIIGPDDTTDLTQAQPTLDGTAKAGGVVEVGFDKLGGLIEGVHLYTMRDGDSGWAFLASETHSPYVDNRPLLQASKPEMRKYKALFFLGKSEVGLESAVIEVTARA